MTLNEKDKRLIALVMSEHSVSTDDPRLNEFADDHGNADDTINRCIDAGEIKQIGNCDLDDFRLVPGWWPYASAEQLAASKRRTALSSTDGADR